MKKTLTLIVCLFVLHTLKAAPVSHSVLAPARLPNYGDTVIVPVVNQPAPLGYQANLYKRRLDSIKKDIQLDYNEYVQSYIEIYARNREEMGRVLRSEE